MAGRRFQILSLDGGGVKGVFSAAALARIESAYNTRIIDHFDLIAGTSTGGIIALGLGLGFKPREILNFYTTNGPKIFGNRCGWRNWLQYFSRKFPSAPLQTALQETLGNAKFGESKKRLVIPSYNIGADDVYVFRTPHIDRLVVDWQLPAWQIGLATSAAPTYFPCQKQIDKMRLIDGGVWANNPTMVAIVEAVGPLGIPLEDIAVCSLGVSNPVNSRHKSLDNGGFWSWRSAGVDVVMRGQSLGANNQAKFLLQPDCLHRLNPSVAADEFTLDGAHRTDDLIGQASHHTRAFLPDFEKHFLPHTAAPYIPCHPKERVHASLQSE